MIKIIIIVATIILTLYILWLYIHLKRTNSLLKEYFKSSVIVFGAKGKGKDLLFQKMIYLKRKKSYLANMTYGYKGIETPIRALNVEPNTYTEFIDGKIEKIPKNKNFEGLDYYLSDGGVYLPSQFDFQLHKKYKSLPIFYALSRQLYNMNIHINTQAITRLWKALREQGDKYIKCIGTIKFPTFIIVKIRMFNKYETAVSNLLPMKKGIFPSKDLRARIEQYNATHGEILERMFLIKKRHIKYDTRHFEKVIFN